MDSNEQPLMVIGHKNPDTDSICSAIAYAHYKRHVAGVPAVPYRAGTINPQTSFVLGFFGVPQPDLVTTLLPKLSDIMIHGNDLVALREEDPLGTAQEIITQRRFAFLPVTGPDGSYAGKISALRLASLLQDLGELGAKEDVPVLLHRLIGAVEGHAPGAQVPDRFTGRIWLPGFNEIPNAPEGPVLAVLSSSSTAAIAEAISVAHMARVVPHESMHEGISETGANQLLDSSTHARISTIATCRCPCSSCP
jgi:CBS domain-containing protein